MTIIAAASPQQPPSLAAATPTASQREYLLAHDITHPQQAGGTLSMAELMRMVAAQIHEYKITPGFGADSSANVTKQYQQFFQYDRASLFFHTSPRGQHNKPASPAASPSATPGADTDADAAAADAIFSSTTNSKTERGCVPCARATPEPSAPHAGAAAATPAATAAVALTGASALPGRIVRQVGIVENVSQSKPFGFVEGCANGRRYFFHFSSLRQRGATDSSPPADRTSSGIRSSSDGSAAKPSVRPGQRVEFSVAQDPWRSGVGAVKECAVDIKVLPYFASLSAGRVAGVNLAEGTLEIIDGESGRALTAFFRNVSSRPTAMREGVAVEYYKELKECPGACAKQATAQKALGVQDIKQRDEGTDHSLTIADANPSRKPGQRPGFPDAA